MPTYTYESIPTDGSTPARFEVVQRMTDAPLEKHPETGEPVRRVISGGQGIKGKPIRRSTVVNKNLAGATPCGCATEALATATGRPSAALKHRRAGHSHGPHKHATHRH